MTTESIRALLETGLQALGIALTAHQQQQLLDYLDLLFKWNSAFNLSGVKDQSEMLSRHILDSLTLLPYITGTKVLDVGTGPGLPGIPLAICKPDVQFDLLDSNGKKSRFVFQARLQLALSNVVEHNIRVEDYKAATPVDVIVSRAFSSLQDFAALTRHIVTPKQTRLVAMKGLFPEEELASLPAGFVMTKAEKVTVPGYTGARHIVELTMDTAE